MLPPWTAPSVLRVRFPSSSTPALSHFWISRTTRSSAIRCSRNFTIHSCFITSKKLRMSASSTHLTFLDQRGEALLPILLGCLPYPLERALRTDPALCPERVALLRVPLGRGPSLHRLRHRSLGLVRQLLRYYDP